jgi:flavin reductase (DIM6/NTAB) family NADH-FMN oxidoreductase RutF
MRTSLLTQQRALSAAGIQATAPDIRAQFLDGMSRAAFCVNVVTTDGPGGRSGVTVSAMSSVSADGNCPTVLVCIHHQSRTAAAILDNGVFCVNVLRADQSDIADCFGGRASSADKFSCASWIEDGTGAPRLLDPVVAFDCRVVSSERIGTHHIFVGEVNLVTRGSGSALIYADRSYGKSQRIDVRRRKSGAQPHLAIGCCQEFASYVMPKLLSRVSAIEPACVASLIDGDQERIVDSLRSGETDVALLFDIELGDDIAHAPLAEWQSYALLPAAHRLAYRSVIALDDLVGEPLIEPDSGSTRLQALFTTAGLSPRLGMVARSHDMVRSLVAHGFGYTILAASSADTLVRNDTTVVARRVSPPAIWSRLVLATLAKPTTTNPLADAFRDVCESYFSSGMGAMNDPYRNSQI